ncbi:hypothetical protein [Nostoc sp. UHCC 0251]|uniref:hypothetical protein n=1 Tax=Nostoc sp. UHCC 0251 TaxID=3110240 RepID=UPI001E60C9A5|nr:hypothetical protein [Nostoc sp. UHCC 0251]MCC5608225.1 hypothetical protein [Nostoc sp. CHAB 5834]MEA5625860.1 hypothetical protein [Nostoc sp. UHCC 0251]
MSDFNDYIRITLERTNLPDGLIGDFGQLIACGESYEYILQSFNRTYYPVSEEDLAVVKRLAWHFNYPLFELFEAVGIDCDTAYKICELKCQGGSLKLLWQYFDKTVFTEDAIKILNYMFK